MVDYNAKEHTAFTEIVKLLPYKEETCKSTNLEKIV